MNLESKTLEAIARIESRSTTGVIAAALIEIVDLIRHYPVSWAKVQRHPLGFLALVIRKGQESSSLRIHLWSKKFNWTQSNEFEIHDHVFNFLSCVLSGELRNEIYSTQESSKGYRVFKTHYSEGASHLVRQRGFVKLLRDGESIHQAGSFYEMRSEILHRTVLVSHQGITALSVKYPSTRNEGAIVIGNDRLVQLDFERSPKDEFERIEWLNEISSELEKLVA